MLEFKRTLDGYNYLFEKALAANETVIVKMPTVSPNKRDVTDIGCQTSSGTIKVYGTLSSDPEAVGALWQEILTGEVINKTVYALKIVNGATVGSIVIREILS